MATQYTSYWLYQKYEKRGSQEAIPVYPNVYSVDADGTMPKVVKIENDTACGYVPPSETKYEWFTVTGYVCGECTPTKAMIHDDSGNTYVISGSGEITQSEVSGYASAATDVVVTAGATSIGNNAFSGFSAIQFVRIPNTVTSIGENAFSGCVAMTECQLPPGVTNIGNSAFRDSTSLAFLDLPDTITSIGNAAFRDCLNFRYVTIPSGLTAIPDECFYNCDGLSDIELPSGITSIGASAFTNCDGIYSLICHATTPPTLGTDALANTSSNLKIYVPSASVDAYKTAWSAYADKIYSIS